MKIVLMCTSPRKHGNTARILKVMAQELKQSGAEVNYYHVSDMKLNFCTACEACMKKGRCVIEDDFTELLPEVLSADGLVTGSPNYAFHMSAQAKVLFDRSHCLLYYTRRLRGKYGAGVAVGADKFRTKLIAKTLAQGTWLCGGYMVGYLWAVSVNRDEPHLHNEAKVFARARNLARHLIRCITTRKKFLWQDLMRKYMLERHLREMVLKKEDQYPFLYLHWREIDLLK
jgi:multimeric flavodoxin WrbA